MLTDIERKFLRILNNYSVVHHTMPSRYLLRAKTGRNDEGIDRALASLAEKGYIKWTRGEPLSTISIIQAYEKPSGWWDVFR